MIGSLGTLVRRTAEQVAADYEVNAALDDVADAMDGAATPSEAVALAERLLRQRSRAVSSARQRIEQLRTTISHLADVLAFTEEGWPERKQELETLLAESPDKGLALWLDDWFEAATYRRTGALARLAEVGNLPAGCDFLLERCATASRGLEEQSWYTANAMLVAGGKGVDIGGETVPPQAVQTDAWLLVARLALADYASESDSGRRERLCKAAAAALEAAGKQDEPPPGVDAVWARWHRIRQEGDQAAARLSKVGVDAPTDLDVVAELIEQAREGTRWEVALDTARSGIDALPTLADVDAELARLVDYPVELDAAVAERAFEESQVEIAEKAAGRAETRAAWNDYPLRATVAELRCGAADARGAPPAERVAAYVTAGNQRLWAGQLELAVRHFDAALSLDETNVEAGLGVADCLVALASSESASQSKSTVDRALCLILDVQSRDEVNADNSWSYLVEANARGQLARLAMPGADEHRWRALLAVCRSIAYGPRAANRWVDLAAAADGLGLYSLAAAAAADALALDPTNSQATASRAQALTNGGRFDEALELLGEDPWDKAARAYILIRLGSPERALSLLRSIELLPTWGWAYETLIMALVLTGRYNDAKYEADIYRAQSEDRLSQRDAALSAESARRVMRNDERADAVAPEHEVDLESTPTDDRVSEPDAALSAAFAHLVMGNDELAERLATPFAEDDSVGSWILGNARVVRGDHDRGLATLAESVRLGGARDLDDWERLSKPFLIALAGQRGVTISSFDPVEQAIAERRSAIEPLQDPLSELATAEPGDAPPQVVELAKAMGAAVMHLASGDPAASLADLEALPPQPGDHALDALRRDATVHKLARDVVTAAASGATSLLPDLVALAPVEAESLIRAEAGEDSEVAERLVQELRTLTASEDAGAPDPFTAPEWPATPERPLEAALPPSWFPEGQDPLNDHPVFLRYIPELRARATWDVPAINIRTAPELEPDRYEIYVLDELVAAGRADPAYVYAEGDAVQLLGAHVSAAAEPDAATGLTRIPRSELSGSDTFLELLTMSADEVAMRHVGAVAREHAHRLADPHASVARALSADDGG